MTNNDDIDAEELRQLINLFVSGGYLREARTDSTYDDGGSPYSETVFWPLGNDGNHIGGWWPSPQHVAGLVQLGLVEAEVWEATERPLGAIRNYRLTARGQMVATKKESEIIKFLQKMAFASTRTVTFDGASTNIEPMLQLSHCE